ncbi:MAG: outer membrane protein assembly factor BamB [Pseudomonadota bacterium]
MRMTLALLAALLLTACSNIKDTTEPPTPLGNVDREIEVEALWHRNTGAGTGEFMVDLSPALDDSAVYVADHRGRVMAVDRENGKRRWRIDLDEAISAGVGVDDQYLYVGSREGDVIALSKADGSEVWRETLGSEIVVRPVASLGMLVVKTIDGAIRGLNTSTGDVSWTNRRSVPSLTLRGSSAPVVRGGIIYHGLDNGRLMAVSLMEGRALWETPLASPRGRNELERMVDVDARVLIDQGALFAVAYQGRAAAIGQGDGRVIWARELSAFHGFVSAGTGRLGLVDEHSQVWGIDQRSGATLWKQDKLRARKLAPPAVLNETIVVGDFEGYLHLLDPSDGRLVGRAQYDDKGFSAAPMVAGDTAYVLDRGGRLSALRLTRRGD